VLLVGGAGWVWTTGGRTSEAPRIQSLAVLPLTNVSGDPEQAYVADGMTVALIWRLSAVRDLRVISRTSVMQFKDTRKSVREIAKALNVDAVVEGSVQGWGDRVRITAQLVRADTEDSLWSGRYDREPRDVLALQAEVAEAITNQIEATVTPAERSRVIKAHAVAPGAYESFLKGLFQLNRGNRTRAAIDESIRRFEEAIAADPTFAPAYAALAEAYEASASTGTGAIAVAEARPKAIAAAKRALELDPQLADAHTILATAQQQEWHWDEAEAGYRRALEIDPNSADAHAAFAGLLVYRGHTDEGIAFARRARELDPLSLSHGQRLGFLLYQARRYDEAIRELRTVLAVEPDDASALWFLGFALVDSLRFDEAIRTLERSALLWDRNPAALGLLARAYGRAGRRADALRILDELKRRERTHYVPPAVFVHAYMGVGDRDGVFAALERAYTERSNIMQFLKTHPLYDPVRDDRRFSDLLHRVGLG
jgi:TolB-like protein/Flp pilus assembly protein TadD